MRRYLILITVLFLTILSSAQVGKFEFKGTIDDDSTNLGISGVTVTLYEEAKGIFIESVITGSNGNYKFKGVSADKNYIVKISKTGYVSKFFLIIGENIQVANTANFPIEMSSSMFKGNADDFYLLEHIPVAIGRYSKSVDNIEWDINYIESIKKMMDKIKNKK